MDWDIAISVELAVLVAVTSGLAGHLAATKTWHKWLFWGSGVIMVSLIGLQAHRNQVAQNRSAKASARMQGSLDQLQKESERLWAFLNPNPTQAQVENKPPGERPSGPNKNKPKPESSISSTPSTTPPGPQGNSSEYHGSVPHVIFPPSNGVLKIVSQSPKTSTREDAPYQSEIIIQSSATWSALKLGLQCNGDLVDGNAHPSSGGMTVMTSQGLAQGHPNIFVYEYQSATPPFSPSDPLQVEVWSKEPVSCDEVTTF